MGPLKLLLKTSCTVSLVLLFCRKLNKIWSSWAQKYVDLVQTCVIRSSPRNILALPMHQQCFNLATSSEETSVLFFQQPGGTLGLGQDPGLPDLASQLNLCNNILSNQTTGSDCSLHLDMTLTDPGWHSIACSLTPQNDPK